MRLEIGKFPVTDLAFGTATRYSDGFLEIDRDELVDLVIADGKIPWARVDIVCPGDPVRLINLQDMFAPQVKVKGSGTVYPGAFGRSTAPVGHGLTHRLEGVAVMLCVDKSNLTPTEAHWPTRMEQMEWAPSHSGSHHSTDGSPFLDMCGPGNRPPYDELSLVVLTVEAPGGSGEECHTAIGSAALRVADRLAQTTLGLPPPQLEGFDFDDCHPSLPGLVYIPHLASAELDTGAHSSYGTSVYGQTRLSAPWVLYPSEMMDGAVLGNYGGGLPATWQLSHNPVIIDLSRRHGKTCNFLGCIVQRTNWPTQAEKEMAASRAGLMARRLGAAGAILTSDQRFLETALTVQACEHQGIKTVLLTDEEDNQKGAVSPLLAAFPELQYSAIAAGRGHPTPSVKMVLGARNPSDAWLSDRPPIYESFGPSYIPGLFRFGFDS